MNILVVGAGAVGGYFGGRLLANGRHVTFLVRPRRAEALQARGLTIKSPTGDLHVPSPPVVLASELREPADVVLLSCKAYDLDDAITSFAPAVGPQTLVLPLLNGLRHLDVLDARFGAERVLGGQCVIATTLAPDGTIVHLNALQSVTFGVRPSGTSPRVHAIEEALAGCGFDVRLSETIDHEMWEKWVFIAASAGITSLFRAAIGDIVAAENGLALVHRLLDECNAIAAANGHEVRPEVNARTLAMLTAPGSTATASMLRDMEAGARIEGDHIIGDLLARAPDRAAARVLMAVYTGVKAYEARRARLATQAARP